MEEEFLESRVNLFVALAPVVRLKNCSNTTLKKAAKSKKKLDSYLQYWNMHELFGKNWNFYMNAASFVFPWISLLGTEMLVSSNSPYNELERVKVSHSTFPSTASWKQLSHYAQFINSGLFEGYDEGALGNM